MAVWLVAIGGFVVWVAMNPTGYRLSTAVAAAGVDTGAEPPATAQWMTADRWAVAALLVAWLLVTGAAAFVMGRRRVRRESLPAA